MIESLVRNLPKLTLCVFLSFATPSFSAEARTFIMGLWPNQLRQFDEAKEEFTGEIRLRYGAVTGYGQASHSADFRHLFYITDRMEAVEIVDTERFEVVDELRLSTPARRVRIFAVAPDPRGDVLYLRGNAVELSTDRFEPTDFEVFVYDLKARELKETFRFPREVELGFFDGLAVSSDGRSIYTIGADVHHLRASDHQLLDTIRLSKPSEAGYGPIVPFGLFESEPGIFRGLYSTTDPILRKESMGIVRVDLESGEIERFELGPAFEADVLAFSPDGKYAYAGPRDLVKIDLATRRIVAMKKDFERGRTNNTIIVSSDGTKLYVSGVGYSIDVIDALTLERVRQIPANGDIMTPMVAIPAR
jgi:hypothetical protein